MCGIVGAASQRTVQAILVEGLRRLEYRGYDSAGVAMLNEQKQLLRDRVKGKVQELADSLNDEIDGHMGIAHTRWATHGKPCTTNAHPHISADNLALVHNGIIENHDELRNSLQSKGYEFVSQTDTEVIVHLLDHELTNNNNDWRVAVNRTVEQLKGAYALGILIKDQEKLIAVRHGSPLVIGLGFNENFFASDTHALQPVTQRFMSLKDGDMAEVSADAVTIYDKDQQLVEREIFSEVTTSDAADKGHYRHYMLKEIFEQPMAIRQTLENRVHDQAVDENVFGEAVNELLATTKTVHIIACGTSYHAGLVAKYWIESLAGVSCIVDIASEYRYRNPVVPEGTLFIGISQSGETADTLAALRQAKASGQYVGALSICNVAQSTMVRESDAVILTFAGREIGVASTKAFTTQLCVLLLTTILLGRRNKLSNTDEASLCKALVELPYRIEEALALDESIKELSLKFSEKEHTIFLGRGAQYPIALEGALKLKEISYIHAEAYPAGELKHGPLALVDKHMPVVCVAPNDELLEKVKANFQEVAARGGELFVFAGPGAQIENETEATVLTMPSIHPAIAPILFTLPLQLLSYHVAVQKGTDVDQPRNLAKSVTVE